MRIPFPRTWVTFVQGVVPAGVGEYCEISDSRVENKRFFYNIVSFIE